MTDSRVPRTRGIRTGKLQALHVVGIELKIINFGILIDARRGHALGQGDIALLQTPPQQDLGPGLSVFLAQGLQNLFVGALTADDGAVGLEGDVALLAPLDDVVAGQPGVDLPLADVDGAAVAGRLDVLLELVEVVDAVVGHADGPDAAGLLRLNQRLPRAQPPFLAPVRRVDQIQVDVAQARLGERRLDRLLCVLVPHRLGRHFAREEDLRPRQPGLGHRARARRFVAVRPR